MDYEKAGVRFREIEELLGLSFKDRELLGQVFIHDSYLNGHGNVLSNERLEFLGDAVIGLAVAEHYFRRSKGGEGALTELRKSKVRRKALAETARRMKLGNYLVMSHGEDLDNGREKKKLLAGCFEALSAAVFIQFGYEKASKFVVESLVH